MRAAIKRGREIVVDEIPVPEPGPGEVLVKTLACGICGSDLHALAHMDQLIETSRASGLPDLLSPDRDLVMGHEFCAEVAEFGPKTSGRLAAGTPVVSMPLLFRQPPLAVGYSNEVPGGYSEAMILSEGLLLEVPNGLSTDHAALTEPMAVGLHAVEKSGVKPGDAALVVGCGPVGLAVVAALRLAEIEPILAADFSPRRRALAEKLGAHRVVDPNETPLIEVYRAQAPFKPAALFECVGVPGVLDQMMRDAPRAARITVAGVCMEADRVQPAIGINKELSIQFVLGYTPEEFARTLRSLAEGAIDVTPLVTGRVGLDDVAQAFRDLANPEAHAKILVDPSLS
ncbi:MAG: zinc-binding dehydrogenase [Proteobacteria bacterium]|nr:zinc-binding dehydrogenase [Pseudomonadota bacterium]